MRKRNTALKRRSKISRECDPIPWKYCLLTLVCGLILVGGFFSAARLHFSSIDYGIKNSKLRNEIKKLKEEKRLLILRREVMLSGISKTARKIGFRKRTVNDIELVNHRKPLSSKLMTSFEKEKVTKASTESETLVKGKELKLKDLERESAKIVKNGNKEDNAILKKTGNKEKRRVGTKSLLVVTKR